MTRAKEPFRFFIRLSLAFATGRRAKSLADLLEGIRTAPESVIYHHTHRFLQQHQTLVPEPPNDFAYWITNVFSDESLGERLAAVDTVRFSSLVELRTALAGVLEEHLASHSAAPVAEGKEFFFMSARRFSIATPFEAWDLTEFAAALKRVSISSLYLHIFEARLRPPLGVNDFSDWFRRELGEETLADRVQRMDPYTQTLEGLRARILEMVEKRLEEQSRASS
jgi:hypothetical protein